jgi:hypothetical protein
VAYTGILEGVQQLQLRTEGREKGDLNELNPYSDKIVTDVFFMELGIRLSFVKTSQFQGWV